MDPAVPTRAGSRGHSWTRQVVPAFVAPVATAVIAAAGLRVSGLGVIDAFGFALAIAWAIAGLITARSADRTAAPLIGLGALVGAIGLTAARLGMSEGDARGPAPAPATLAAGGGIAGGFLFLRALPDGRLGRPGRRIMTALGYASAGGTAIGLAVAGQPFTVTA